MNKQVLLIDDDYDEQDIFKEAINLTKISCKFICASTAAEGLRLVEKLLPDFVFLDLNMPCMNGLECLQEIKKENPSGIYL